MPENPSTVTSVSAAPAFVEWLADGQPQRARWRSERDAPPPKRVACIDDTTPADTAYRLACEGTALLWQGDFQNARHLLDAMVRRVDRVPLRKVRAHASASASASAPASVSTATPQAQAPGAAFHRHRQAQGQRARVLSQLLIPLQADRSIALPRAPDLRLACEQAWGPPDSEPSVVALRELLGLVSAFEWRKKGVPVPALGPAPDNRIRPHYGVYSPVRGEYLDLVAHTALPPGALMDSGTGGGACEDAGAFDIGTGTGVLAALLAHRGVKSVVATDLDPRALACAQDNLQQLGLLGRVQLLAVDLFPPGRAGLVVCNPPWLPARPGAPIERAVYDEDSHMLRGFLAGLRNHLLPGGEGWLILSDLAEHLGLRTREQLLAWVQAAGLQVLGRIDTRPTHRKAVDAQDPLHAARAAEVTSLWRLGVAA